MTHTHSNLNRRPRRECDNEQEMAAEDNAGDQPDIYGMLGYRRTAYPLVTTQQWLAVRLNDL